MRQITLSLTGLLLLSACASAQPRSTPKEELHPAALAPEPSQPVKVVTVAQPLPLPGQLEPYPEVIRADHTMPAARVTSTRSVISS